MCRRVVSLCVLIQIDDNYERFLFVEMKFELWTTVSSVLTLLALVDVTCSSWSRLSLALNRALASASARVMANSRLRSAVAMETDRLCSCCASSLSSRSRSLQESADSAASSFTRESSESSPAS